MSPSFAYTHPVCAGMAAADVVFAQDMADPQLRPELPPPLPAFPGQPGGPGAPQVVRALPLRETLSAYQSAPKTPSVARPASLAPRRHSPPPPDPHEPEANSISLPLAQGAEERPPPPPTKPPPPLPAAPRPARATSLREFVGGASRDDEKIEEHALLADGITRSGAQSARSHASARSAARRAKESRQQREGDRAPFVLPAAASRDLNSEDEDEDDGAEENETGGEYVRGDDDLAARVHSVDLGEAALDAEEARRMAADARDLGAVRVSRLENTVLQFLNDRVRANPSAMRIVIPPDTDISDEVFDVMSKRKYAFGAMRPSGATVMLWCRCRFRPHCEHRNDGWTPPGHA